jgi:hypothetical protein
MITNGGIVTNPASGASHSYVYVLLPNGDLTFSAPGKFLGNVSGATGLSYDLIYAVGAINYQPTDVILMGNGETLLWKSSPDVVPGPS